MAENRKDQLWGTLVSSVQEALQNEGRTAGTMTAETTFNRDLEISSLDFVHLLLSLEEKVGQSFPFEQVALRDGEYRTDLTLGELWTFMVENDTEPDAPSLQQSA